MTKMLIVVGTSGKIEGAAHIGDCNSDGLNTNLSPLPGQVIHEVDVPEKIAGLRSGHQFHMAISHACFDAATRTLIFKTIEVKKAHP